jgi:hypothetical protein
MDFRSLILGLVCLAFLSCVAEKSRPLTQAPKTFVTLGASPSRALILSEQFLEWQKGYSIQIRDHTRGLSVTDWTHDSPAERHRITLKASLDPVGTLLSAHTESQVLENQDWIDLPSTGDREAWVLGELKTYIDRSIAQQSRVGQ